MFRSSSSYNQIEVRVPVRGAVVDVATGDTLAVNKSDTVWNVIVPVKASHVTILRTSTDSSIVWKTWKPVFHGLALLNFYNYLGFIVDQLSGASGTPEIIDHYTVQTTEMAPSEIQELDKTFASEAGVCGPSSIFGATRQKWLIVASGRFGVMGPATEAILFGNTLQATVGIRPLHFFEVSYDYVGVGFVGLGDIDDASIKITSAGLLIREPYTSLYFRCTFGVGRVSGIVDKYDRTTKRAVSGTVPCWSYAFGYSVDWATCEFRQIFVPAGQTIDGARAVGKLTGFTIGVNIYM